MAVSLLVVLVGLAYGNSLSNGFTFDDTFLIVENPLIRQVDTLPTLLTSDYWAGQWKPNEASPKQSGLYRPVVLLTYAANYAVSGLHPFGYHLVNLLLHAGVCVLLYLAARHLGFSWHAALLGAGIFAIHPIHTEAVTGIVGRAELLMSGALFASLYWALRGRHGLSLAAFAIGLLSKEQAMVFPLLLVLIDSCRPERRTDVMDRSSSWQRLFLRYGSYGGVLGGYLVVRRFALGTLAMPPIPFLDNPLAHVEWAPRFLTAIKISGHYLWLCVWPRSLSADYSYDAIPVVDSWVNPGVLFAFAAWALMGGLAVWAFRRDDKKILFCLGLMGLTFLPVSNLLLPIGTILGERLFYLPSSGVCLLAGLGWNRLWTWMSGSFGGRRLVTQGVGLVMLVIACLSLLGRTIVRNEDWQNNESLFRAAAHVTPGSAKVHSNLASLALNRGEWQDALQRYQRALAIYPDYQYVEAEFNINLGVAKLYAGQIDGAIEALERAVALEPRFPEAHYNLGLAYTRQELYKRGEEAYRRAIALGASSGEVYNALSYVLNKVGRYEEAQRYADAALEERPEFLEALYNRARALEGLGKVEEAVVAYGQILVMDPGQEVVKQRRADLLRSISATRTSKEPGQVSQDGSSH